MPNIYSYIWLWKLLGCQSIIWVLYFLQRGTGLFFIFLSFIPFAGMSLYPILGLLAVILFCLGVYFLVTTKTLIIDIHNCQFKFQRSCLGIKYGNWHSLSNYRGIILKYIVLTDKKQYSVGVSFRVLMGSLNRYSHQQYQKTETWNLSLQKLRL